MIGTPFKIGTPKIVVLELRLFSIACSPVEFYNWHLIILVKSTLEGPIAQIHMSQLL